MGSEREKVQRKRKIHSLLNFSPSQMFSLFTSIFSLSYFSPSLHSSLWEKERESGGRKREREREKWGGERKCREGEKYENFSWNFLRLFTYFLSWIFSTSTTNFPLLNSSSFHSFTVSFFSPPLSWNGFLPPLSQNGFLSRNGFLSPSNFISGFL